MAVHRGDTIALSNGPRTLTTLQVANLRVDLAGGAITGGTCSPDQYFGAPLTSAPTSLEAGFPTAVFGGSEGTGQICPSSGDATGLPSDTLAQTDDQSGGQTVTEVADVADTFPLGGETIFGSFTALADATDGGSPIALTITRGGSAVFSNPNVDTANGVSVPALTPGIYTATWTSPTPTVTRIRSRRGSSSSRRSRVRKERRARKGRRVRKDLGGRSPR
jgi:hypothetical protein